MHRNTKITAKYTQNLWLALVLPFILTAFPAKADTSQTTTPDIKYQPLVLFHIREKYITVFCLPLNLKNSLTGPG